MSSPPGRQMPTRAATEPRSPLRRSPTRTAMLVALSPGRLWLMETICTKVGSSSHLLLRTRLSLRYARTPPPTLVAPMTRKVRKISTRPTLAGAPPSSFMVLGRISVELVNHAGLGGPEEDLLAEESLHAHE